MEQQIYRESSLEKIQSPDQLDQYLKVTKPSLWILLVAILLLLGAAFWWSFQTEIISRVTGVGTVRNGVMTVVLTDETARKEVKEGMAVQIGEFSDTIDSIQTGPGGETTAVAFVTLPDGTYDVQISYKSTQILKLLFN